MTGRAATAGLCVTRVGVGTEYRITQIGQTPDGGEEQRVLPRRVLDAIVDHPDRALTSIIRATSGKLAPARKSGPLTR